MTRAHGGRNHHTVPRSGNVHDMEAFANDDCWDKRAPDRGVHNIAKPSTAPNGNTACASAARFMGSDEGAP